MLFPPQNTLPTPTSQRHIVWILVATHLSSSLGYYPSYNLKSPHHVNNPVDQYRCHCNYTEIFTELPYFLQELGQDDRFQWAFQGSKGERGADGPQGPAGLAGRNGNPGAKGDRGEPGPRGIPGTSLVFNPKGSFLGSEKGERGIVGPRGITGKKGDKGEPGTTFTTVLKDGSYIEVKGQKGDRGGRGRKGLKGEQGETGFPGRHGLSIQGQKGEKGEPVTLPDIEFLRGPPGPRGPSGLPGSPGIGCGIGKQSGSSSDSSSSSSCENRPVIIPLKGAKGDQGPPGVSLIGEKGDVGPPGPPGSPGRSSTEPQAAYIFTSEKEMRSKRLAEGTLAMVSREDRVFIKVITGWREISLGPVIPEELNEVVGDIGLEHHEHSNQDRRGVYYSYDDESSSRKQYFSETPRTKFKHKNRHYRRIRNKVQDQHEQHSS